MQRSFRFTPKAIVGLVMLALIVVMVFLGLRPIPRPVDGPRPVSVVAPVAAATGGTTTSPAVTVPAATPQPVLKPRLQPSGPSSDPLGDASRALNSQLRPSSNDAVEQRRDATPDGRSGRVHAVLPVSS